METPVRIERTTYEIGTHRSHPTELRDRHGAVIGDRTRILSVRGMPPSHLEDDGELARWTRFELAFHSLKERVPKPLEDHRKLVGQSVRLELTSSNYGYSGRGRGRYDCMVPRQRIELCPDWVKARYAPLHLRGLNLNLVDRQRLELCSIG
jgi:hypothetical protein